MVLFFSSPSFLPHPHRMNTLPASSTPSPTIMTSLYTLTPAPPPDYDSLFPPKFLWPWRGDQTFMGTLNYSHVPPSLPSPSPPFPPQLTSPLSPSLPPNPPTGTSSPLACLPTRLLLPDKLCYLLTSQVHPLPLPFLLYLISLSCWHFWLSLQHFSCHAPAPLSPLILLVLSSLPRLVLPFLFPMPTRCPQSMLLMLRPLRRVPFDNGNVFVVFRMSHICLYLLIYVQIYYRN